MGKRHAEHPVEKGSFLDDFLEWMDSSEGQQSIEAHDLVFDALENAGVDPRQRKIVWDDGQRLSIQQSAERIHAGHTDIPLDQIEIHVVGWLESCAPESCSERQLEELDRLIGPWLDDYERTSRAAKNSRELGTLKNCMDGSKKGLPSILESAFDHFSGQRSHG
jgi:hypothetical protein